MGIFKFNDIEYTGNSFKYEGDIFYVDGHAVADFRVKDKFAMEGNGTLITDKDIIIYGEFKGDIKAEKVIINGEHEGIINANKVIDNR